MAVAQQSTSHNGQLFQRMLAAAGKVVFYSLICAFAANVLILGLFYLAFEMLIRGGCPPEDALFLLAALLAIMIGILISLIRLGIKETQKLSQQIFFTENIMLESGKRVFEAFLKGFKNGPTT